MHLNEEQLIAFRDRALADAERIAAENHLAKCDTCRGRMDTLNVRSEYVAARLAALEPSASRVTAPAALLRFQDRYARKEIPLMNKIFSPRYRPAWALVAVIALLTVSMSFAPVRAWAEGMLAQFRVERVQVLSVDPTLLNMLGANQTLTQQISQLLSDSMQVTKKPNKAQTVDSAAKATLLAGFTVRLPTSRSDIAQIIVQDSAAFQFTVNRARAQTLMDEMGYSRLQLPASLDGALIKAKIPAGVSAAYGQCPKLGEEPSAPRGSPARTMLNCTILAQIPSPTVDTPPNLNVQELAVIGLQVAGMKLDEARAFAQTVDWTSTLVVPVPRNSASSKQVQVDGVSGYLIQRPLDDAPQYALIWVKNGIVYAIGGLGNDTATAMQMGNSLK